MFDSTELTTCFRKIHTLSTKNIYYKTDDEVELIRHSCHLVGKAHAAVAAIMRPGLQTQRLDEIAEQCIRDNNAVPGFKGYDGFPATLCISVNEQVVHGLPSTYELREGDVVSVDCGVIANGFYGDSAYTYCIGEVKEETRKLLSVTKKSLYKAIEKAIVGNRIGDISFAVQQYVEQYRYSVVRELVGHGVGRSLHEEPQVPNYGQRGKGVKLLDGLVIAIEPMINMGRKEVKKAADDWTIVTADGKPSAHFEHTIVVRKQKADILSTFEYLQEAIKNNPELIDIP
ncbi:MAG: type I methionyl aminopeptidase [Sphingobacteriales bacterium]|jgi:methionyl aminopeptidase|nr:type I methionyl aminopeptidase [Sphingobacteriales bacterium]